MKRLCYILLTTLMMLMIIACNNRESTSDCKSAATEHDTLTWDEQSYPFNRECNMDLLMAIPDHGIKPGSERFFTPDYYALLQEAWAVPSDGIGEIGSDEWLYYFISGNAGWDTNFEYRCVDRVLEDGFCKEVFELKQFGEWRRHCLTTVNRDSCWLIYDFDSTRVKMQDYIERQREYFQSKAWQNYLAPILAANDEYSQQARERIKEVNRWLKL